jgi:hypothetical protein
VCSSDLVALESSSAPDPDDESLADALDDDARRL